MNRSRARAILMFVSLGFALAASEIGLRVREHWLNRKSIERAIASPPPLAKDGTASLIHLIQPSPWRRAIYELRPNLALTFAAPGIPPVRVETSAAGFRDRDYPLEKGERVRRIVGIGDSLMFGWGVPPGADYLSLVEERLNSERPGWRWDVINMAVPGYNLAQEVETLERKGIQYSPDLVVVGFFENDADLPNFIGGTSAWASLRRCFLCELVTTPLKPVKRPLLVTAPLQTEGRTEADPDKVPEIYRDMVGLDGFSSALNRLRALALEHDFEIAVLVFMTIDPGLRAPLMEEMERQGVKIVDAGRPQARFGAARRLQEYCGTPLTVSATDCHPSALSHQMAAKVLAAYIKRTFPDESEKAGH